MGPPPRHWPGQCLSLPKPWKRLPTPILSFFSQTPQAPTREAGKRSPRLVAIEALLFSAVGPQTIESLAQSLGWAKSETESAVDELGRLLDTEESALMVERLAGGVRLATREEFHGWLVRAGLASEPAPMAEPMAETLAVVAYRQPVTRAEIDNLRGGPSADLIRQLLERRLIKLAGRQKTLGRPAVYRTTRQFLEWLGAANTADIPAVEGMGKTAETPSTGPSRDMGADSKP